jgi:PAS domain S-box-containing protein
MDKNTLDYNVLFDLNPVPSCVFDMETLEILSFNKVAVELFGFSKNESIIFDDLFVEKESFILRDIDERSDKNEGKIEFGILNHHKNSGQKLELKVTGQKVDFQSRECIIAVFELVEEIEDSFLKPEKMLDSSLDVFCVFNEKGEFVSVSAACENHWGYSQEELIGTRFQDLILKEDIPKTKEVFKNILDGNNTKSFYNRYTKKNGEIAYNLWSSRWDESTGLNYAVARDYKEYFEIKEEILRSEQRFKSLVQGAFDLIGVLDVNGYYTYMSPSCIRITGFQPEAFVGTDAFAFVHPDDVEQVKADFQESISSDNVNMRLYRAKNDIAEWRWVETTLRNLIDESSINGIVVNSRDVTERVEEKNHLKLLESAITNTTDAVLITEAEPLDEPGPRIIYVNEAFTEMTGYTAEEVIGKSPRILQGPNSNKEELAELGKALRNWEPYEITTINYKKNGEEFWINFTVTPVADDKGRYTHWVAIEHDVTKLKIKEFENELLAQISQNFNVENSFSTSAQELCNTIRDFADFDWVELWTANIEHTQMNLYSHAMLEAKDEYFYIYDSDFNISEKAEGLAGSVWSEEKLLLWDFHEMVNKFIRIDAAKKIGLNAILGIPLVFNNEVVGVLKVGSKQGKSYLEKHATLFKRLQNFIGSELNRKKLENDLSHLFNAIPDIICLLDFDERILKINKSGCELLGYKEEDILYHVAEEFVHPDDRGRFLEEIKKIGENENTFNLEIRCFNKSGEIIWLSWYCNPAQSEGLIYATAKDITEEKKLRELNEQVNKLAQMGSWELNAINKGLFWSDEIHKLHGTDPQSFQPTVDNTLNFWRKDFHQFIEKSFENAVVNGESFDFEAVIITTDKKEVWVRTIGRAETINGEVVRVYGSIQNISKIKNSENRLLAIADNLPGLIYQYTLHPDGTDSLGFVLGDAENIWGFKAHEIQQDSNLTWSQVDAGGDLEKVKSSITDAIETKSKWSCRMRYVMPTGELRTHLGYGTPYFHADGTVTFNSIILDVTEQTLNEELLEHTQQMASIGSWEVKLSDQTMYWSEGVHKLHGTNPNTYNPSLESAFNFYREDFRKMVRGKVNNAMEQGEGWDFEAVIITADNKERWIRAIGSAEMVNGKCVRLFGGFQGIHDQKIATLKLKESLKTLEDYKFSLDQSAIIAFTDSKGVITSVNDNFCRIAKYSRDEIIGKTHKLFNSKYHTKDFFKDLWGTISSGEVWRGEIKNQAKDGSYYWVDTTIVPFLDENNKPIQYLAIRFDITLKKETTLDLEQANERFVKVTEATNDAIWDWDIKNDSFYRSNAIRRFFGKDTTTSFSEEEFWKDDFHSEDLDGVKQSLNEAISDTKCDRWEHEYRLFNKKGDTIYTVDRGVIIRDDQGKAIRMVGAMTDISDQKRMELELSELNKELQKYTLELERSNEELEQFAFIASHDLQEPLRMVSGFMDQLKRKYGDQLDDKAHQYIHFATDGAKRMKQIILDLLEYSRASRLSDEKEEIVSLKKVVDDFIHLRKKLIAEKSANITFNKLPEIKTYKAAVIQIIHCLLDNALKYSKKDVSPVLEINASENESEWLFSIKDNGIGIDPKFHDKIFVIFQRLHNQKDHAGTGIGLSVAKRHIEVLGGRIWMESELGKGSIFYFTLPKV